MGSPILARKAMRMPSNRADAPSSVSPASGISNPARRPRARSSRTTPSTAINASDGMGTGSAAAAGEVEEPWAGSWPGLGPEAFDLNAGAEELDFKGGGGAGLPAIFAWCVGIGELLCVGS